MRFPDFLLPVLCLAAAPLAAAPDLVISEFMASNDTTLQDDDGEHPDWIEIYNAGASRVSLDGLFLSDDAERPAKWRFPAVNLDAGAFLVVFASGKDRRSPAAPLHTNFKLETTEGFLGLFDTDGASPISQYAPYPPQETDFSYGLAMNATYFDLVPSGAAARVLVPSAAISSAWTEPGFDDSGWLQGQTGVGYDRNPEYLPLIKTGVRAQMDGVNTTAYIRIPFTVEDPSEMGILTLRVKYDDGFIAYLNGARVAERNAPASPAWNSRATTLHDDSVAVIFEDFTITGASALLEPGPNVLAIHGLNDNVNSSDFLILPELTGADSGTLDRDQRQFFARGTPGGGNVTGYPGISDRPAFSRAGGVFTGTVSVSLSSPSPQAAIRYTLDRSEPTESSLLYSAPLSLSAGAMVRARAFEPGLAPSAIASESYLRLATDLQSFTSDLPLVLVDNFGAGRVPTDPFQTAFMAIFEEPGARTSLTKPPRLANRIGIKVRGSSTAGQPKPSYTLEVRDERGDDLDVEILGMPADSDWVLYGPCCFDRALLRNAFIYEISNQVGRYAVRTRFVETFFNTGGGSLSQASYAGVYVFMEKISRGKERVDVEELLPTYNTEPLITGGYMIKIDRRDPGDTGFSAGGQALSYVEPKEDEITPAQAAWLTGYLNDFAAALNGANFRDPDLGYAWYIDRDSWIDHHILNVLPNNVDALRLSAYLFMKREGRIEWGPIWDFDRSMDSTDGRDDNPQTWKGTGDATDFFNYPWWGRLFQDPDFWQLWKDRWQELRRDQLSDANIEAVIDSMADEIAEAEARDAQKYGQITPAGWRAELAHIKDWLSIRSAWIDSQFVAAPAFSRGGGPITPGFTLSISAPTGAIYYTADGTDPRLPGGAINPQAVLYSGPLTLDENARVVARAKTATDWSGNNAATYVVSTPPVVITEVMFHPPDPDPASIYLDEDFEFIELQNLGSEPVSLEGFRFLAGIDFTFPGGSASTLAPGEYLVVVRNFSAFRLRYDVTGLKVAGEYTGHLANSSDTLELVGPLREPILRFTYSDLWYPLADGQGLSLNIIDPHGPPASWAEKESWGPSTVDGGTPGGPDPGFPGGGGFQLPGDSNQDGRLDLGDAISLLLRLFSGEAPALPCEGAADSGANLFVIDLNADRLADLSDAIHLLGYLYREGPAPARGTRCASTEGCPSACAP